MGNLLTQRAVVAAKIETTTGTDAAPSGVTDGILAANPTFSADVTVLNRAFSRNDLSPLPHVMGRVLAKASFECELRGSGTVGTASVLGRLLRACGYSERTVSGTACINVRKDSSGVETTAAGNLTAVDGGAANATTWVFTTAPTILDEVNYRMTAVVAGTTAVGKVRFTSDNPAVDPAGGLAETFTVQAITGSAAFGSNTFATTPIAPSFTVTNGAGGAGEEIALNILGWTFLYTTVAGDTVANTLATNLSAFLNSATPTNWLAPFGTWTKLYTAAPSTGVVTVTFSGVAAGVLVTNSADSGVTNSVLIGASGSKVYTASLVTLVLGSFWTIKIIPPGVRYVPISTGFSSITLDLYFDGTKHKLTGCFGTFVINAKANDYPRIQFDFIGNYLAPVDAALPSPTYETTLPAPVELAQLAIDSPPFYAVCTAFTYTQANQITPRQDVNFANSYNGVRIVSRAPTGGIDPEAELVGAYDFWTKLKNATQMGFGMRCGVTAGNIVLMSAPAVQYTGLTYKDRDSGRAYDAGLGFRRQVANDEFCIHFA